MKFIIFLFLGTIGLSSIASSAPIGTSLMQTGMLIIHEREKENPIEIEFHLPKRIDNATLKSGSELGKIIFRSENKANTVNYKFTNGQRINKWEQKFFVTKNKTSGKTNSGSLTLGINQYGNNHQRDTNQINKNSEWFIANQFGDFESRFYIKDWSLPPFSQGEINVNMLAAVFHEYD